MRVGIFGAKKSFGPYSKFIYLITIGSFLISIVTQACPEYISESISPPSRFSSPARIVGTEKGFVVVQDEGIAREECKKEAAFACINFSIGKALHDNQTIAEINEKLKIYLPRQLHVERIAKSEGLYVTYRKSSRDPTRVWHYFFHEKNSHTGRYLSLPQKNRRALLIELLNKMLYQKIRDDIKVLFSPEGGCEEELINAIDGSENSIDAAVYSFTNTKIQDALKRAQSRGVAIRLFLNGRSASNKLGKELESYGVKVKYYSKRGSPMHNKFMIIDEKNIYSGSYNWTRQAEKENRENLIALPYVEGFRNEFDYLWDNKERPPPKYVLKPVEVLFPPDGECENKLKELIEKVKNEKKSQPQIPRSIKIALYYFTNIDIAKALFDAKEDGVDIEIILDKSQKKPGYSVEKYFNTLQKKSGGEGGRLCIKYYRIPKGMENNKFAVIGDVTVTGSYNWTKPVKNKDKENLIVLPSAIKNYRDEFDRLMKDADEEVIIDEGKYYVGQPCGPPLQEDISLPQPAVYAGRLVRGVKTKYADNMWTITKHDVESDSNRYTQSGIGGIYAGCNSTTTLAELKYHGYDLKDTRFGVKTATLYNMFDLTDPDMLTALRYVETSDLVQDRIGFTHLLGEFAYRYGYNGIIAQSARYEGVTDIPGKVVISFPKALEEMR